MLDVLFRSANRITAIVVGILIAATCLGVSTTSATRFFDAAEWLKAAGRFLSKL